uniref:Movement protein n=1 Tax=Cherry mottle leaf virus TaxID=131226 RepID=A0A1D9BZJ7_9VIRU|nr:movement protein [Cherry mottle leaf virus]
MTMMMRAHKSRIAEGDIPISGVKSSRVYSDVNPFRRASDLMIHWNEFAFKIMPDDIGEGGFRLMSIPVMPKDEIEHFRRERGSANYVHWGALSISIDALFKKQSGVTGRCVVFDKRWENCRQSILQTFEFTLDSGSATMITSPNFSVSLDDPNLNDSLCVVVVFNDLNFKSESYPVSVRVGNMCRFFDSFLSSEIHKKESNVYIDSAGADLLSYKSFGFGDEEEVERLFSFAEAVPTEAIDLTVREIPGNISNLFRKKRITQYGYGSKSDPRRSKGKRLAGVRSRAVVGEFDTESFKAGENCDAGGAEAAHKEVHRNERHFAGKDKDVQNVGEIEPHKQGADRVDCFSVSGESASSSAVRSGEEVNTEVNFRQHCNPRDVGLNGIYLNDCPGYKLNRSGSSGVLQSEDDCWVDKTFRIDKRG